MKTLSSIFFLILLFVINSAKADITKFTVTVFDGRLFTVNLDNQNFVNPTEEFVVNNLNSGKHYLKLMTADATGGSLVFFEGYVEVLNNYKIESVVTEGNKLIIYKKARYNGSDQTINQETTGKCTCGCECCLNCPKCNPNYRQNECEYKIIDEKSFNILKKEIAKQDFENYKLEDAKYGIDMNWFTSNQVLEICQLFSFENNKLDIAKYAYKKTCDKNNYIILYDIFSFISYQRELKDFVRSYKEK